MGEEKEIEEGDTRQRACSSAGDIARGRGAARVVAHGTPAVGAVRDDADGRTYNGRDCCSDDAADDGRKCLPDDADSWAYSSFGDASDADGRTSNLSDADDGKRHGPSGFPVDSNARNQRVRNANVVGHRDLMMRTRGPLSMRSVCSDPEAFQ